MLNSRTGLIILSASSVAFFGLQAPVGAATIDQVSIFVAPGFDNSNPNDLSDWFSSTFLRVDLDGDGRLTADETVSEGNFDSSSDSITTIGGTTGTVISYSNTGKIYRAASGFDADIWQVNYGNLGLSLPSQSTGSVW